MLVIVWTPLLVFRPLAISPPEPVMVEFVARTVPPKVDRSPVLAPAASAAPNAEFETMSAPLKFATPIAVPPPDALATTWSRTGAPFEI
jgi:hypothetical protein